MKKILLPLFVLALSLVLVSCSYCEHEASKQWEADNEVHYHVCTKCGEHVDEAEHAWPEEWTVSVPASVGAAGSEYRQCSVCKKTETREIPAIVIPTGVTTEDTTIYVKVPVDWESVNCYYWNSEAGVLESSKAVGWPGFAMACVDVEENVWGCVIPEGVNNIIFNNGSVQTADLLYGTENNAYEITTTNADNKYLADYINYVQTSEVEVPKYPISEAETFTTIYVQFPAAWEEKNIHFWGAGVGTEWPGDALTLVDAEKNVYSYELSSKATGVIFNNNAGTQTSNILPKEGVNGYVVAEDGTFKECEYKDGTFTEVSIHVETVLFVKGSMNAWSDNEAYKLVVDGTTASITITLTVGDEFKVATSAWDIQFAFGNVVVDEAQFGDSTGNIKCLVEGTYLITVTNYDSAERACTITLVTE